MSVSDKTAYSIHKLASGSYDVELNGKLVAGLVRTEFSHGVRWTAELLEPLESHLRPVPFTDLEHDFPTLSAALNWLGVGTGPELST